MLHSTLNRMTEALLHQLNLPGSLLPRENNMDPTPPQLSIPRVVYGTAGRGGRSPVPLTVAFSHGCRAFDIASNDPHDEDQLGAQLQELLTSNDPRELASAQPTGQSTRNEITIQAKYSPAFFFRHKTPPYLAQDPIPSQVIKSFKNTLQKLQVSQVDVNFLHRPFESLAQTYAAWEAMQEIKRQGGCRMLGISQVDITTLKAIWENADEKPAVVQNPFLPQHGYCTEV